MYNRQVTFASGGMLSAFKPVGDGSHEPPTNTQSSDSNPQSASSHSASALCYPVVTSTAANQPWEPTVLIKPHSPTNTTNTVIPAATPTKRKDASDKVKVKKKKKKRQEVDHSGFVPRKIVAGTSSTVRNPLLVTPLASEKKEENELVKETDDLFSLYDDFDVASAVAPPTDHTFSSTSIWDSFEATTVQQLPTVDSEGSCDVSSSEEEDEYLDTTPTMDHVSRPVVTSVDHISTLLDEKNGSGSIQHPDETHPQVEESRHERLLRLLGMPMKSFLSAGHQCPLKEHTTVKVTNSGSYLDKPYPSKYCMTDNHTTVDQGIVEVIQVKNEKLPVNKQQNKKPDGLSFGLSKKREKLRQCTTGQLFDKEDSPV